MARAKGPSTTPGARTGTKAALDRAGSASTRAQAKRSGGSARIRGESGRDAVDEQAAPVRLLFQLHHMMMRVGDKMTEPLGLTSSRWMMLCLVGKSQEPRTVAAMSQEISLSPQNISRMVAAMEAEGLIERERGVGRGRAVLVRLTAAGRAAYRSTEALGDRFVTEIMAGFSPQRAERLQRDLADLIENIHEFEQRLLAEGQDVGRAGGMAGGLGEGVDEEDVDVATLDAPARPARRSLPGGTAHA